MQSGSSEVTRTMKESYYNFYVPSVQCLNQIQFAVKTFIAIKKHELLELGGKFEMEKVKNKLEIPNLNSFNVACLLV